MRQWITALAASAALSFLLLSSAVAQGPGGAKGGGNKGGGGGAAKGNFGKGGRGGGKGAAKAGFGAPQQPPAPRDANGRILLGGEPGAPHGVWLPGIGITEPAANLEDVSFQPWAKALYDDRQPKELEPHARCKASGAARQFMTPYGVEFVDISELGRMFIFDIGGPHTFRTIYMDGRSHPDNLQPTNYGHSIGWWEGDTLVVDTIGYNEDFWLDRRGLPHTEQLHTIERFTRTNKATIDYKITIDDPGAYTAPYTGGFNLRFDENTELFEYVCQQANYASELMVGGAATAIDRSSTFIP